MSLKQVRTNRKRLFFELIYLNFTQFAWSDPEESPRIFVGDHPLPSRINLGWSERFFLTTHQMMSIPKKKARNPTDIQCYPLLPPFIVPGTRNLLIITGAWRTILRPLFRSTRSGSKGRTGSGGPTSRKSFTGTWTAATCTTALPG